MDYYEELEISRCASADMVQAAYALMARRFDPNIYRGDMEYAAEKMKRVYIAYSVLSDPHKRMQYDAQLDVGCAPPAPAREAYRPAPPAVPVGSVSDSPSAIQPLPLPPSLRKPAPPPSPARLSVPSSASQPPMPSKGRAIFTSPLLAVGGIFLLVQIVALLGKGASGSTTAPVQPDSMGGWLWEIGRLVGSSLFGILGVICIAVGIYKACVRPRIRVPRRVVSLDADDGWKCPNCRMENLGRVSCERCGYTPLFPDAKPEE